MKIILVVGILSLLGGFQPAAAQSNAPDHQIFFPLITFGSQDDGCEGSPEEQAMAEYMRTHPDQERPVLNCDPTLAQVARLRAADMATRNYFSHTNPDGFGPNYLVQQAGYRLPSFYDQSLDGNNIESIQAGCPNASDAWSFLMNSTSHRRHLLGLIPFYAEQIDYGIGYAYHPESTYKHYWVIITARH